MLVGELFISCKDGIYLIKVNGRATFDCAPPLRNLAKTLEQETFSGIRVDLAECGWMDSTFMGILAMIGLRAAKIGAPVEVVNASKQNIDLLCGLGLKKLFRFVAGPVAGSSDGMEQWKIKPEEKAPAAHAKTVLDAHETLMDIDEENVKKFGKVVNLVRQDLGRLGGKED